MRMPFAVWVVCLAIAVSSAAQEIAVPEIPAAEPARAEALRAIAAEVIAKYAEADRAVYLRNLYQLQIAAGRHAEAIDTLAKLRAERGTVTSPQVGANDVPFEILARGRASGNMAKAFREVFGSLDDRTSAIVAQTITNISQPQLERALQGDVDRLKGRTSSSVADALRLGRDFVLVETFRALTALGTLVEEDDKRRYTIENDVRIPTSDGATVCAHVMRPRTATGKIPALLSFTIYADPIPVKTMLRRTAANGYASVVAFTRGKLCSDGKTIPYENDGADAAATLDWIAAQPWSDGRAGMYGGSYSGFTAWAAAKRKPKALKTIFVGAPVAPGIDVPMEGNVAWSFVYPWPFYTANNKTVDNDTYNDVDRWNRLNREWYVSGRAYRDLPKIDGTPNPIFDRWIAHPSYDAYWRAMIPYRGELKSIDIPILTTAGYYYGGPGAAVYYLSEHAKYNPRAEHYLVIGPYDHFTSQRGTIGLLGGHADTINGYRMDPVARIDMGELRYEWFDYALRGGPRPAILKDRVNYQVTGANVWKHAPTLAAMAERSLRFYLAPGRLADKPSRAIAATPAVDFKDRSDADVVASGGGVLDKAVDTTNGIAFISEPFKEPIEMSGLFSGRVEFITNRKDFDFAVSLYELTPAGEYVQLAPYWTRASYVRDRTQRQLLKPGRRERLDFRSIRLMSRRLAAGSRLVAVLQVIKETGRQINYGSGKDVNDETIADAKEPLRIQWLGGSYLEVPVAQ